MEQNTATRIKDINDSTTTTSTNVDRKQNKMNETLEEQTLRLAFSYAQQHQKYVQFFDSFDDFVMSLTCHLLEHISQYDDNIATFGTFAFTVFHNYVKRTIMIANYQSHKKPQFISLDTVVGSNLSDDNVKTTLGELIVADEDTTFEDMFRDDQVKFIYCKLLPLLSRDFIEHYAYNKSFKELAKERHISKQAVNQKVSTELEFIRYYVRTGKMLITNSRRFRKLAQELEKLKPEINDLGL